MPCRGLTEEKGGIIHIKDNVLFLLPFCLLLYLAICVCVIARHDVLGKNTVSRTLISQVTYGRYSLIIG